MYKPWFSVTHPILNDITAIAGIKTLVERSRVLPLNEAHLKRQAIIRMTHTSTSIEGNPLAEYQVEQVLSGKKVTADDKSILEVKNYQEALVTIDSWAKEHKKLTLELILRLHRILMKGILEDKKTGQFRQGPIYIVDDLGDHDRLRFTGPGPKEVPGLVKELLEWLYSPESEPLHPIIKAGITHLHFVSIHPFSDGNGRMTRLLATYILYSSGWDFRKILVLDDFYNRNRQAYYNALNVTQGQKFQKDQDITPWLEYFTHGFLVEAQKVSDQITAIGFGGVSGQEDQIFLDKDELKLMDFLATIGRLTSSDAQDILGIPKRTAQFKLKGLIDKGLIKSEGKGPSVHYIIARS